MLKSKKITFMVRDDERFSEFTKGNCHGGGCHEKWQCFKNKMTK